MAVDTATVTGVPWLARLDAALAHQIDCLRARYSLSLDEFRGLYVSDAQVDEAVRAQSTSDVDGAEKSLKASVPELVATEPALARVQDTYALTDDELAIVLIALATEVDRKYEAVFAYLNDNVTRRHATVDLCLKVSGAEPSALEPRASLLRARLLDVVRGDPNGSWLTAAVVARDPIRRCVLRSDVFDVPCVPDSRDASGGDDAIPAAIGRGLDNIVINAEQPLADARCIAAKSHKPLIVSTATEDPAARLDALTSARLHGAFVFYELAGSTPDAAEEDWIRTATRDPAVTLFGIPRRRLAVDWEPLFEHAAYEVLTDRPAPASNRVELWSRRLADRGIAASREAIEDVSHLFSLTPSQIRRAADVAAWSRRGDDAAGFDTLALAARRQSTADLGPLATRVEPRFQWDDLVLPAATRRRLREFISAIRAREHVFGDWAFARTAGGSSLRVMFTGAPGTGKTMSVAVISRELGLDVFRIDLSAVVSKYIGETEKNLERIFTAAAGNNVMLFFDEADALFGKRSEVKDAHDRYANIEIAYLLQRMEQHDGVMILATNLANNLDEAFSRRIHLEIEFPLPDAALRTRLWHSLIPAEAPLASDVDISFMAEQFQLTGGEIHNAALTAALLAAHEGTDICMRHLVRAVARLRRRQRKLPTAAEFKQHLVAVRLEDD